tara:strand:- start:4156 stop:4626 length:471 start_codon:yes stop_codon:yes gene_type:complete
MQQTLLRIEDVEWAELDSYETFNEAHEGVGVKDKTFVFYDGEPREVIATEGEGDTMSYHLRPTEQCPTRSCVPMVKLHILSNDDKLLLCPERILTDAELEEALRVAQTTRATISDKPTARAGRKKTAQKQVELEMDAETMADFGLDKLQALIAANK